MNPRFYSNAHKHYIFFTASGIPDGYRVQFINGFVEELVMNDDPEYQWIDKIRTPRASNEARQTLFLKLSGIIQRKIGLKALELGGNAVLGWVSILIHIVSQGWTWQAIKFDNYKQNENTYCTKGCDAYILFSCGTELVKANS